MRASQGIFLAIAQLAPSRLIRMHLIDSTDRAENPNAYVQGVPRVAGALD